MLVMKLKVGTIEKLYYKLEVKLVPGIAAVSLNMTNGKWM